MHTHRHQATQLWDETAAIETETRKIIKWMNKKFEKSFRPTEYFCVDCIVQEKRDMAAKWIHFHTNKFKKFIKTTFFSC